MKFQRDTWVDLFWDFVILTDDRVFQCLKVAVAAAGIIGNQVGVLNDPVTVNRECCHGMPLHGEII